MVWSGIWNIFSFQSQSEEVGATQKRQTRKQRGRSTARQRGQEEVLGLTKYLNPWESTMINIQSILIWENPIKSLSVVVSSNIAFWYLAYCEVRFFFLLSLVSLIIFLHHQWVYVIWPEISVPKPQTDKEEWTPVHPDVLSAPEVSRYLDKSWVFIQRQFKQSIQLRRKQPGWFCAIMIIFFSIFWLLGHFIPGVVLLNILLILITCGPAFAKRFIPKSFFVTLEQLASFIFAKKNDSNKNPENELEEFLPEESSPEVQSALGIPFSTQEPKEFTEGKSSKRGKGKTRSKGRGGRKSAGSNSSEVGNSLISGLSEKDFPSLDETYDKTIEESDLIPEIVPQTGEVTAVTEGEKIHFEPKHFGDTSDEEEEFTFGLAFNTGYESMASRDEPTPSISTAAASLVLNQWMTGSSTSAEGAILSSIGQQIVNAMNTRAPSEEPDSPPSQSSDVVSLEDEFEFISEDEIQEI